MDFRGSPPCTKSRVTPRSSAMRTPEFLLLQLATTSSKMTSSPARREEAEVQAIDISIKLIASVCIARDMNAPGSAQKPLPSQPHAN
eukprot:5298059-Prorocentrum_lima.AAC.1